MKIAPVHVTCAKCKTAVFDGAERCPNCGNPITWPTSEKPAPTAAPRATTTVKKK